LLQIQNPSGIPAKFKSHPYTLQTRGGNQKKTVAKKTKASESKNLKKQQAKPGILCCQFESYIFHGTNGVVAQILNR